MTPMRGSLISMTLPEKLVRVGLELPHPLLDDLPPYPHVGRDHDVLGRVLPVEAEGYLRCLALFQLHYGVGVGDPRLPLKEHGRIELLADVEGDLRKLLALGGVPRLEHGDLGEARPVPAVLLVLGAVDIRVVRHHDDEPALDARVGERHERVGRDVQAHVLHAGHGPCARKGSAGGDLDGDLLIRRPLGGDLLVPGDLLEYLAARGAGVGACHRHAGLPGASRNCFVSL